MGILFDQGTVTEFYEEKLKKEAREEGRKEGRLEEKMLLLFDLVKDKLLSVKEAAKRLGVSEKEFMRLSKT